MATKKATAPKNRVARKVAGATKPGNGNGASGASVSFGDMRAAFAAMSSLLGTRAGMAAYLGQSFGGDRDLYTAVGYTKNPTFQEFMSKYRRQDIAKAVIDIPVRACWRKPPTITESEEDQTDFERAWETMAEKLRIWHYFSRVDRLASIGEYAILLVGFNDGRPLNVPVEQASRVMYVMPYSQDNAKIATYVADPTDPRFSLPEAYDVQIRMQSGTQSSRSMRVHWSRVIHVSEDNLEDDVLGIPRLEALLNRLQDLELVSGSCAEMFWRGAFPGFGVKADEGFTWNDETEAQLETELEEYTHQLRRYLRLKGITIDHFEQQISDPSTQADLFLTLISAVSRIPKRILLGSEQGELASSQDETNWWGRVDERRREHCDPTIIRQYIDRCIAVKALPAPPNGYNSDWPDLLSPSDKDKAEVAKAKSEALATYVASGAETVMPPEFFLERVMGYDRDDIEKLNDMIETMVADANGDGTNEDINPTDPLPEDDKNTGGGDGGDGSAE